MLFEQHIGECELCRESLKSQQRANAALFAAFSPDRLAYSLRGRVLAHLPEMEAVRHDPVIDRINERAKNPITLWGSVGRLMPAAAVVILVFVTLVLRYSVTDLKAPGPVTTIGMVTHVSGRAMHAPGNGPNVVNAELQTNIMRGDRFETRQGGAMMLALTGPTSVKMGDNTRVFVTDPRNLTLDYGQIWLDVGQDGRVFKVHTPRGEVTVFGTRFTVSFVDDRTTVTVERGEVQVEKDEQFCMLDAGQQAAVETDGSLSEPLSVDAKIVNDWARRITPDPIAENAFASRIQVNSPKGEIPSRLVYVVNTYGRTVPSLRLYWQPDPVAISSGRICAYDLYVSAAGGAPIMHRKLESSMFSKHGVSSLEIVPDTPIVGVKSLEIRLVPDYKTGSVEIQDVEVKAMVMEEGS